MVEGRTNFTYKLITEPKELPIPLAMINSHLEEEFTESIKYTDSGTANAVLLSAYNTDNNPLEYISGLRIRFIANAVNTGASTVNVNSLGVKSLFKSDGTSELDAGYLTTTKWVVFEYDSTLDGGSGAFKASTLSDDEKEYDYIEAITKNVVSYAEKYTSRDITVKTYETYRDCFPDSSYMVINNGIRNAYNSFRIQKSPLSGIDSIEYLVDSVWTEIDSSVYYNTLEEDYSTVLKEEGESWPTDKDSKYQSIKITFQAGYDSIPNDLLIGLLNHIAWIYTHRGDCDEAACPGVYMIPKNSKAIYDLYKIIEVFV